MRNFIIVLVGISYSALSLANISYIKCSLDAGYEIYRGEGMVERAQGSLVASPVAFGFFTNGEELQAKFPGGFASLTVKGVASEDEAKVTVSGGRGGTGMNAAITFHPRQGGEQILSSGQIAPFNYTGTAGRISFTRAVIRCLPAVLWDQRPVIK
jgi:hypothetical protein